MAEHKITWSFSALKTYKTCPKKYHAERVLKLYGESDNDATRYGKVVHSAFEHYMRDGKPLPPDLMKFKGMLDKIKAIPGELLCEYEMALLPDKTPCPFDSEDRWVRGIADLVVLDEQKRMARVVDWKGLSVETLLPTPSGWTTMGDVQVGDQLFSGDGSLCHVVGKSEVKNIRCFKVRFDDTTEVVCDENHLWKLHDGSVVSVADKKFNTKALVPVAGALDLPYVDLLVDPYVLGVWLADGKHTSGEICKPDNEIWEEIQRRGYAVNMATGGKRTCPSRTVLGLNTQLKTIGVRGDKHIPQQYLRASFEQRLDLLRGLMDGDGSVNAVRKQCVFSNTNKRLSLQVRELLCTLGQRPLMSTTKQYGFGLTVTAYPVSFRPMGINPFLLSRKRDRVADDWGLGISWRRRVTEVIEVESVPTQCIAVDSADHTFLCTERMVPTHNTGSAKYPDIDQLNLMALMLFAHYPWLEVVKGALLFIHHNSMPKATYQRKNMDKMWQKWQTEVARLENSYKTDTWYPNPNGLCRSYCAVEHCAHNGA